MRGTGEGGDEASVDLAVQRIPCARESGVDAAQSVGGVIYVLCG